MSMLFSLLMKMDAGQAKAELRALQGELQKGKAEVSGLGAAASTADAKIDAMAAAERRAAQSATQMDKAHRGAQGSVGNLVANFNDMAVMIAAGQNPLQMALQQGTQITQVIGPMGATGAFKAMGGAVASMLSPMNLATLGIIAFGSMAIQWLSGSGDAAETFTDKLKNADDAIEALGKTGRTSLDDLRSRFGTLTPEIVAMQDALVNVEKVKAFQAQREALLALKDETAGSWFAAFTDQRFTQGGQIAELLNADWLVKGKLVATDEVNQFRDTLASLDTARGPRDQLAVFKSLQQQILAATGGIEQMNSGQMAFYEMLVQSERQLRQQVQTQNDASRAAEERARAIGTDNARMGGPMAWDIPKPEANISEDLARATELLSTLQEQANVQVLISQYGRDSAQVALARTEAERAAFEEMVNSLDVSSDLKDRLMEAWGAANGLASARIAAMIEAALGPASALNGLLKSAAGWWGSIKSNMAIANWNRDSLAGSQQYGGRGGDPRDFMPGGKKDYSGQFVYDGPALDIHNNPVTKGGGGGGGGGAKAERDAVADLIARLKEEQQVLRETDPVQKEMLKYRKQLAEASAAQRAEVEELVRAEARLKAAQSGREYAADSIADFLDGIILKGGKASDILASLANQFASMAMRSIVTGKGWFAELFGFTGGLFGMQAKADGGMIYGPGGPRDDKVPIWASAGEFMVNARATAKYRPVLERINSGNMPGFADGGLVGDARYSGTSGARIAAAAGNGAGSVIQLQPVLVNNTSRMVDLKVEETTDGRGQRQQRYVISDAVAEGLAAPGGAAARNMQQTYGLRPAARRRT